MTLFNKLQLGSHDKLRSWMGSLVSKGIVIARGVKKGTEYLLSPTLLSNAHLNIAPTLKTIEPHKLEALIFEDIKINGDSKMAEIASRLPEVSPKDIQKAVCRLKDKGEFEAYGGNRNKRYTLSKKNNSKINTNSK